MKNVDRYFYPAVFTYEPGREIAVVFPDLGVATSGTNEDDALLSARELLGCTLYGLEQDGKEIPMPSHLIDVETAENERVVLVDVYMPLVRQNESDTSFEKVKKYLPYLVGFVAGLVLWTVFF